MHIMTIKSYLIDALDILEPRTDCGWDDFSVVELSHILHAISETYPREASRFPVAVSLASDIHEQNRDDWMRWQANAM